MRQREMPLQRATDCSVTVKEPTAVGAIFEVTGAKGCRGRNDKAMGQEDREIMTTPATNEEALEPSNG